MLSEAQVACAGALGVLGGGDGGAVWVLYGIRSRKSRIHKSASTYQTVSKGQLKTVYEFGIVWS